MPIYKTYGIWSYVTNESKVLLNKIEEKLTKEDIDFDTKEKKVSCFFQKLYDWNGNYILRIPTGLVKFVHDNFPLSLESPTEIPPYYKFSKDYVLQVANKVKEVNECFEIRDYQLEATMTSLNNSQSLILSGVGTGKTSVLSLVCKSLSTDKILILNDSDFILGQIRDRLLSFGITDISCNIGKKPDFSKRICIFNTAGSYSSLKNNHIEYIDYLKTVNTIIVDETQHFQAISFFLPIFYTKEDVLRRIIGYTGSPFRNASFPYTNSQDMTTIALLGEPNFTYEMKDTIEDGTITQPYVYFIRYKNFKAFVPEKFKDNYFMQYRANITNNKNRNAAGIEMLKFLNKNNINTFASVTTVKLGQRLMKTLKEHGVNSKMICGGKKVFEYIEDKKGKLKLLQSSGDVSVIREALMTDYNIIFATQVLDEGVDIDIFQATVLFAGGKSPISGIQRIGRSARKKEGRNVSFVIDFRDIDGHYMFRRQYEARQKTFKENGIIHIEKVADFCDMIINLNKGSDNNE